MSLVDELQKKELLNDIIVGIITSLVIAFVIVYAKWPITGLETLGFGWILLISLLIVFVFIATQKLMASTLDCKTTSTLLTFRRYWFRATSEHGKAELSFDFPAWLVLPLILMLLGFKWLAILNFEIEPKPSHVRRRWSNITESDVGKIAIVGPFAVIILGLIFKIFGATNVALLCMWFAFLTLIPIGLGFKMLNSSRILWFFSFVFSIALLLLISLTTALAGAIIALILAAFVTILYYTLYER